MKLKRCQKKKKINLKKNLLRHIIMKFSEVKDKEKALNTARGSNQSTKPKKKNPLHIQEKFLTAARFLSRNLSGSQIIYSKF
jgi:hypothetical protein